MEKIVQQEVEEMKIGELKLGAIKEGSKLDPAYKINNIELYNAVSKCSEKIPLVYNDLVHEAVISGGSDFQNWLIGELLARRKLKFNVRRLGFVPANVEIMEPVKKYLTMNKEVIKKELLDWFGKRKESFEELLYHLPFHATGSEDYKSSVIEEHLAPKNKLEMNKTSEIYKLLIQLAIIADTKCRKFTTEFNTKVKQDKTLSQQALLEFSNTWHNYFLTALELNSYFIPLNDAMNEVADTLKIENREEKPQFSVWRLFTVIFKNICYRSFSNKLRSGFINEFINLSKDYLTHRAKCLAIPTHIQTKEEVDEEVKRQLETPMGDFTPLEKIFDDIHAINQIFQSLFDFSLNEYTVHYINSKRLDSDFCGELKESLREIAIPTILKFAMETKEFAPHLDQILTDLLELHKELLPACLWDEIDKPFHKAIRESLHPKITALVPEFDKFSPKETKEFENWCKASPQNSYIIEFLNKAHISEEKLYVSEAKRIAFIGYLQTQKATLYNQYVTVSKIAARKQDDNRVLDIEIAEKNTYLGIVPTSRTKSYCGLDGMKREV